MSEKLRTTKSCPLPSNPPPCRQMGRQVKGWLRHKWHHHRMALVLGLSISLHLLAWGGIEISQLLDPADIPPKPEKKKKISLAFIKQKPKPKPEPKVFVEVPKELESEKQPDQSKHFAERPAQAASLKASDEPDDTPNNPGNQPGIPSLKNAPPAPPKINAASNVPPQSPAPMPKPARPAPAKTATPETEFSVTIAPPAAQPRATDPAPQTSPKLNAAKPSPLPIPDLELPDFVPANTPTLTSAQQAALDRLNKARAGTNGFIPKATPKSKGTPGKPNPFSLDVEGLFDDAEYDKQMITAIFLRWVDLNHQRDVLETYRVVLHFEQMQSGAIRNLQIRSVNGDDSAKATKTSTPGFICASSIQGLSPYGDWPASLRQRIGRDFRRCRFTFTYTIVRR